LRQKDQRRLGSKKKANKIVLLVFIAIVGLIEICVMEHGGCHHYPPIGKLKACVVPAMQNQKFILIQSISPAQIALLERRLMLFAFL
jgi:hypothetical protein